MAERELRDYFAARALPGIVLRQWEDATGKVPDDVFEKWARAAYKTADWMMRVRAETMSDEDEQF